MRRTLGSIEDCITTLAMDNCFAHAATVLLWSCKHLRRQRKGRQNKRGGSVSAASHTVRLKRYCLLPLRITSLQGGHFFFRYSENPGGCDGVNIVLPLKSLQQQWILRKMGQQSQFNLGIVRTDQGELIIGGTEGFSQSPSIVLFNGNVL